jgi:hypothetical protein
MSDAAASGRSYASCPTEVVDAPIEHVWSLVTTPEQWGGFYDLVVTGVTPRGSAQVGQEVIGVTRAWGLPWRIFARFMEVNESTHSVRIDFQMPFGLRVVEAMHLTKVAPEKCRVTYGCNFEFPNGWRGTLLRWMVRNELEAGPAESLARLKRAAEAGRKRMAPGP